MEPSNAPTPEGPSAYDHSGQLGEEGACRPSVDAVALDLVRAATDGGDDALVKTLLRSLVALELTDAATFWAAEPVAEPTWPTPPRSWIQRRGFGGPTPAPSFKSTSQAKGAAWTLPFGEHGALVVRRETFDRDGLRDHREDQLESLVVLAETLLSDTGPLLTPPGLGSHSAEGTQESAPASRDEDSDRRRAG